MDVPQLSTELRPVLSTEEVAELLRLNPKTVLAMARDGRLPGHRLPGCRKVQYLTAEILASVAAAPGIDETTAFAPGEPPSAPVMPAEVDPCDVWGAAASWESGEDWRQRCRDHWVELAKQAGLSAVILSVSSGVIDEERSAGRVEVDGLCYEVLVGPRQRTRYVDDEGDVRWGLIDSVWVEPIEPDARSHNAS
jgi:excisionase family DNA binding protein